MNDLEQRKLLSVLCHGAIFLSSLVVSIAIPIVVLVVSTDPIVQANAKESINFHINFYIYFAIFGLLSFVLIGLPFLVVVLVLSWVMPILAMVQVATTPDRPYRYPFLLHLV
jgi:uncharacterized protein